MSKAFNDRARHFFRNYRNGRVRIGHSFIRRLVGPLLGQHQEIQLRSGLKLSLDMTKGNQNAIFWHDGDVDVRLYWAVRELLPVGGTFIDCGANCGLMGLLARQYRQANVIFFEPHPRLAETIRTNIQLNSFDPGCEVVEAAVSDAAGELTFYEHSTSDGSHSVHQDWGQELPGAMNALGKVPCVTLQDFIEKRKLAKIDFLKIDTEGNDYAVLKGMGEYLRPAFVDIVYVEMSREQAAMSQLLASRGYVGFPGVERPRQEIVQLQRDYEGGGRASFFAVDQTDKPSHGDVLWCGKNSAAAAYLTRLADAASQPN